MCRIGLAAMHHESVGVRVGLSWLWSTLNGRHQGSPLDYPSGDTKEKARGNVEWFVGDALVQLLAANGTTTRSEMSFIRTRERNSPSEDPTFFARASEGGRDSG